MKKYLTLLFGVGVLATAAALVFVYFRMRQTPTLPATLIVESGQVQYRAPQSTSYQNLPGKELDVVSGTAIKTDKNSYARVFLPDNSLVSIDQSTEVTINFTAQDVSVEQVIGNTWHRVKTLVGGGSYQVTTPNTIAAVRGTIFGVSVDGKDSTKVDVAEHNVEVSRYELENQVKKIVEKKLLNQGDLAWSLKDKTNFRFVDDVAAIEEAKDETDSWRERNAALDSEYIKLRDRIDANGLRRELNLLLPGVTKGNDNSNPDDKNPIGQDSLSNFNEFLNISEATCKSYSKAEMQEYLSALRQYRGFVKNADILEKIIIALQQSCADGKISVDEAESLQTLVQGYSR